AHKDLWSYLLNINAPIPWLVYGDLISSLHPTKELWTPSRFKCYGPLSDENGLGCVQRRSNSTSLTRNNYGVNTKL
ncbi:unnamed protein product, partial [Dovyalis caffra]